MLCSDVHDTLLGQEWNSDDNDVDDDDVDDCDDDCDDGGVGDDDDCMLAFGSQNVSFHIGCPSRMATGGMVLSQK